MRFHRPYGTSRGQLVLLLAALVAHPLVAPAQSPGANQQATLQGIQEIQVAVVVLPLPRMPDPKPLEADVRVRLRAAGLPLSERPIEPSERDERVPGRALLKFYFKCEPLLECRSVAVQTEVLQAARLMRKEPDVAFLATTYEDTHVIEVQNQSDLKSIFRDLLEDATVQFIDNFQRVNPGRKRDS